MKRFLVALVAVLPLHAAIAQSTTAEHPLHERGSVGISVGLNLGAYREETYANVAQSIEAVSINLHGEFPAGGLLHGVSLFWYVTEPESPHRASLDYSLAWAANDSGPFPNRLGVRLRTDVFLQFAHYPSVTVAANVGPVFRQYWQIDERNSLSCTASTPLFGWALRPPYAGADALMMQYAEDSPLMILTMGGLTSPHNLLALDTTVTWTHEVTSAFALSFEGGLSLSRFAEPRPRHDLAWAFTSGAVYTY
ncbi:MAG: hypothetical protein ACOC1U_02175 [Spirochaetota bacterium]